MADPKKLTKELSKDDPAVYSRPRWAHATRIFGAFILFMLNFTVVMSAVERFSRGRPMVWEKEIVIVLFILACDVVILYPMIFEVDMAKATDEYLILKTMFWKTAVPWADFIDFRLPMFLKYALLRTRRCCYFINKRQLRRFESLAETIVGRTNLLKKP